MVCNYLHRLKEWADGYVDAILPKGSRQRRLVRDIWYKLLGRKTVAYRLEHMVKPGKPDLQFDVLCVPQKYYHAWSMSLIAGELSQKDISACMLDITDHYKDERLQAAFESLGEIPLVKLDQYINGNINYRAMVVMNDWDEKVTRPLINHALSQGKITIGMIEGINDFHDRDVKWSRNAYRTVEYLLLTGDHDKLFFDDKPDKAYVIGVPRLDELMKEAPVFPKPPKAVINLNFTYGVLAEKRKQWLKSAIKGCELAGIDYVITQHPADNGLVHKYPVSKDTMYDAIRKGSLVISRFGSIIIEALALGKPVVYHNPHHEKVIKFQDPMGAYSLSDSSETLAKAIQYELSLEVDYRQRANAFLEHHCAINQAKQPAISAAEAIEKIFASHEMKARV